MKTKKTLLYTLFIFAAFLVATPTYAIFSATAANITDDLRRSNSAIPFDADGDGDIDIYVSNTFGQQNRLWINDGTGLFTPDDIAGDLGNSQRATVGDIDSDGDLDIYTPNDLDENQQNKLWINDGAGNFTANDIAGDEGSSWDSAMFDVDSDGDLDIYVANHHTQQNKLWINDGTGSFTSNDIAGDNRSSGHVIAFDADSDGDTDMYVGEAGQNKLWINDGTGNFTANDIVGDTTFTYGGDAGDVDGDGDLDLYVTTWGGAQNKLWINDGAGNFTANDIVGDTNTSRDAVFEDLDLDGDLDLYTFVYASQNLIWINDGTGSFTAGDPIVGDEGNTFTGFLADLSGDTFVDLYSSNNGQNRLWLLNILPHITITAPTKTDNVSITDTTIEVIDEKGILAANVLVDASSTATTSALSCSQTTSIQVDCTISIDTAGDLVIVATDTEGGTDTALESGYNIDTTPPNISVTVDTITNGINTPIFTFSATDNVAVDYFEVTYNTDNAGAGIGTSTTDSPVVSPLTLTLDPDEVLHTVVFTVYDTAGNSDDKTLIFPPVVNFTTPTLINNTSINDATVTLSTPTGNDIENIVLTPGTTGATLGTCTGDGGDLTSPYAQPVVCTIDGISSSGTLMVTADDSGNGATGQNSQTFIIDVTSPTITITAPTKEADMSITDTLIQVVDDNGILAADVTVDGTTSATTSLLSCAQTSGTQVDCTISIDSSGDLVITADDQAGNTTTDNETGYVIDTTDPVVVILAPTKANYLGSSITDTTIQVNDNNGVLASNVLVDPGTTATTSSFLCTQTSATQVDCTISIDNSGDLVITADDQAGNNGNDTEVDYLIVTDIADPIVTITAPTVSSASIITDTTIQVTDDYAIDAADVVIDPITTASTSAFLCAQITPTQVDCTISIDTSGNLVILASDRASKTHTDTKTYTILTPSSSRGGGSIHYICKDPTALNYNDSEFGRHKTALCDYSIAETPIRESTKDNPFAGEQCTADFIVTDNMKRGDRNGNYSSYNKGTVTQVNILQLHMNRLLFDEYGNRASGPVDGIYGPLTQRGVKRLQQRLNQLLPNMPPLVIDGIVGPFTRAAVNNSC